MLEDLPRLESLSPNALTNNTYTGCRRISEVSVSLISVLFFHPQLPQTCAQGVFVGKLRALWEANQLCCGVEWFFASGAIGSSTTSNISRCRACKVGGLDDGEKKASFEIESRSVLFIFFK